MLKSNNQKKVSQLPQPCLAVLNGSADHTGRKKKKEKDRRKKRGENFLLKLDLVQLARRGGFLNACET